MLIYLSNFTNLIVQCGHFSTICRRRHQHYYISQCMYSGILLLANLIIVTCFHLKLRWKHAVWPSLLSSVFNRIAFNVTGSWHYASISHFHSWIFWSVFCSNICNPGLGLRRKRCRSFHYIFCESGFMILYCRSFRPFLLLSFMQCHIFHRTVQCHSFLYSNLSINGQ